MASGPITEKELAREATRLWQGLKKLGPAKRRARIVILSGNLGAGKTTFVKAFARRLGVRERVASPTFVFMHEHALPKGSFSRLIHVDCYRIESKREFESIGIRRYLKDPLNLLLMEWGEKAQRWIPKPDKIVRLSHHSPRTRRISIS